MTPYYKKENEDLETHVSLCAERYQGIQNKFESLDGRLEKLEDKVDDIKQSIIQMNAGITKAMITTGGTVLVALISIAGVILNR